MRRLPAPVPALRCRPISLALALLGVVAPAYAAPEGGVIRAGQVRIDGGSAYTRIEQSSVRAVIDWRSFSIGVGERVQFLQPSASAATLNRVTGDQVSVLLGRMDANGQVFLINPNGIVIGNGAQIDVGGLIASTANIHDQNFMTGRLLFDDPGKSGAGISNAGVITAAEGGLVALVAPHVRNDGLIQARLGRVVLGAADTFSLDLYGDGLVSLAMADGPSRQLLDQHGEPVRSLVTQAGEIDTAGGKTVLVTADTARNVLDSLINMSGTVKADAAVQQGGRILLLGKGGTVEVSGSLSAQGAGAGQTGGLVEVLGEHVVLAEGSGVTTNGTAGGGTIRVGGAWQGSGDTYRAATTLVAEGARLDASAGQSGNGGEVVVWSDRHTRFAGDIAARGGALAGNGGRAEVSGKQTLDFLGRVDAGRATGLAGSLLLDPAYLDIGAVGAAGINDTLRTGTSVSLLADVDIYLRAMIYGLGGAAGGGVSMRAGNNIDLYHHIVTNNGAVNLTATGGAITVAPGYGIHTGSGPISLTSAGNLGLGTLVTTGSLSATSTAGNLSVGSPIYETTGNTTLTANAGSVNINQTIANTTSGANLTVSAAQDINIAAGAKVGPWDQVTGLAAGRSATPGGRITLTAGNDINVGADIVSYKGALAGVNDAPIQLTATSGTLNLTDGIKVMSDKGAIHATAGGNLSNGPFINTAYHLSHTDGSGTYLVNIAPTTGYFTTGDLHLTSTGGSVTINQLIPRTTGSVTINAANAIQVNQRVYTAGGDIAMAAGGGGITVTGIADPADPNAIPKISTGSLGDMDAQGGNITLQASGDVRPSMLRSAGTITLKSTAGSIVGGSIEKSRRVNANLSISDLDTPSQINLAGYAGISDFTGTAGTISAISSNGSITNLGAGATTSTLLAKDDIQASVSGNASLYAGRDISLPYGFYSLERSMTAKAGRNLTIGSQVRPALYNDGSIPTTYVSIAAGTLTLSAGAGPFAGLGGLTIAGVGVPAWGGPYGATYGDVSASNLIYVEGVGGMTVNASRNISLGNVHVSNTLYLPDAEQITQPVNLTAGANIDLVKLETTGTVSIASTSGNIAIGATLGGHLEFPGPGAIPTPWNLFDLGVASLQITANNGNISMYEARATAGGAASGFINIAAPNGQVSLQGGLTGIQTTTAKSVTDRDGVFTTGIIAAAPVARLPIVQGSPTGPIGPGPTLAGPDAPTVPGAPPPGTPGFAAGETLPEIHVTPVPPPVSPPASSPTSSPSDSVNTLMAAITGSKRDTTTDSPLAGDGTSAPPDAPLTLSLSDQPQLVFEGGRGPAQEEDLGR